MPLGSDFQYWGTALNVAKCPYFQRVPAVDIERSKNVLCIGVLS